MTIIHLTTPPIENMAKRLRLIADAIDGGQSLSHIALVYHIPVNALEQLATPKVRRRRRRKDPSPVHTAKRLEQEEKTIQRGIELYRQGTKIKWIEDETGLSAATLYLHLGKAGIPKRCPQKGPKGTNVPTLENAAPGKG